MVRRHLIMAQDLTRWLEPQLRKVVGLSPEAPQAVPIRFGEPGEDGLRRWLPRSPEDDHAEYRAWVEDPLPGRIIGDAMSALRWAGRRLDDIESVPNAIAGHLRHHKASRQIAHARALQWRPWHYAADGESLHIDGRLQADEQAYVTLDVGCVGDRRYWADEAVSESGGIDVLPESLPAVPTIVLPTQVLTAELVECALKLWYMQRFTFCQGHWALIERTLPDITVDSPWETGPVDDATATRRAEARSQAHRHMNGLLRTASQARFSTPPWADFGVTLNDLLLPE